MVEFLLYQVKTAVILAVYYMFYRLLLSRDTFHRFNRIVLLGTAALSFILPLCVITIHKVVTLPSVPSAASDFVPAAELSDPIWPVVLCAVFVVGANIKEYQYLLVRKAVSKSGYSVANSFNHSTLKKRITMMLNKKSSRMSAWKALYIIPLVGISLAATAKTKVDYRYQEPVAQVDTTGLEIIQISSYNKETGEKIVKKDVSIRYHDLNQEQEKPLVVLDGVLMGKDFKIESIDPHNIRSITVLKEDKAVELYGPDAKTGVVVIKTKSQK